MPTTLVFKPSEPFMRFIPVQVCQSAWNAKPHTVNTDPASMRIQSLIIMPSCTRSPKTKLYQRQILLNALGPNGTADVMMITLAGKGCTLQDGGLGNNICPSRS